VPVFFAVDFFAAAVLRFAGFFRFATAMMSLLSGWLAFNSLCYTHSLLDTHSRIRDTWRRNEGKATAFSTHFPSQVLTFDSNSSAALAYSKSPANRP
jgi:hypothetical protein